LQDPPKFTQIGIFGLKIYHLAILLSLISPLSGVNVMINIFGDFRPKKIGDFLEKPA
jgi:hypothetical protein